MRVLVQLVGYLPGTAVPAAVSFAVVLIFTRYLTPEEFGRYALVVATVQLADVCCLDWLRLSLIRYHEGAVKEGARDVLLSTAYVSLGFVLFAIGVIFVLGATWLPIDPALRSPMLVGCSLLVLRGIVRQNLAVRRAALQPARFSLVACTNALLGLTCAVLFVVWLGFGDWGLVLGLTVGAGGAAVIDSLSIYNRISVGQAKLEELTRLLRFGMPMALFFALAFIVSTSDRYLLQYFLDTKAVGVYAAGYGLAQQAIGTVFVFVNLVTLPVVIQVFERGGAAAARRQMQENFIASLALGLPATIGLILVAKPAANVLLGLEFRATAAEIIPWIVAAAFLACLKSHYFDHSFHLGQRMGMAVWTVLPPAVVNIALNVMLIPFYGVMGAVYATVIAYLLGLALSIMLGRRTFAAPLPIRGAIRILLASVPMAVVLLTVSFPDGLVGLVSMILAGAGTYGLSCLALDVAGLQKHLVGRVRIYWSHFVAQSSGGE